MTICPKCGGNAGALCHGTTFVQHPLTQIELEAKILAEREQLLKLYERERQYYAADYNYKAADGVLKCISILKKLP